MSNFNLVNFIEHLPLRSANIVSNILIRLGLQEMWDTSDFWSEGFSSNFAAV